MAPPRSGVGIGIFRPIEIDGEEFTLDQDGRMEAEQVELFGVGGDPVLYRLRRECDLPSKWSTDLRVSISVWSNTTVPRLNFW